jgi:GGDEF domain-containing protein
VLARFGGDEFALVMAGAASAGADEALARLRTASAAEWSVGVVEWERGETLDRALARADAELYRAKRTRRPCEDVAPWTPAIDMSATPRIRPAVV